MKIWLSIIVNSTICGFLLYLGIVSYAATKTKPPYYDGEVICYSTDSELQFCGTMHNNAWKPSTSSELKSALIANKIMIVTSKGLEKMVPTNHDPDRKSARDKKD